MKYTIAFTLTLGILAGASVSLASQKQSLCILGQFAPWLSNRIDAIYKQKLNELGYQVGSLDYSEVNIENLKPYNMVLMEWVPSPGNTDGCNIYRSALPALRDFVQKGGGILVTCEESYNSYKTVNEFLKIYDAEILPENIVDEKTLYRQQRYLQWYFCSTNNIIQHPITSGIKEIWYPLGHSPENGTGTLTLRLGEEWQTIVKGNKSAHSSQGTISSEPPMIAVRQVGDGGIAVFPSHSTFWTHAGYHRIWENICLEKGDGFRLLVNIYDWLGESSLSSGVFGGYAETQVTSTKMMPQLDGVSSTDIYTRYLEAGGEPFISEIKHQQDSRKDFVGIIGAHTSYSNIRPNEYGGGVGSVAEYCERAKKLGYSYIVFTEDFRAMTMQKWDSLVADCKLQTTDDFIAIPGIEYQDTWDNRFIAFNLSKLPEKEWLSDDGQRVKNLPGIYFGFDWPSIFLMNPHRNFTPPWSAKFYSGIELESYIHGNHKIDEAFNWYRQVQGNDYNLIPIISHRITSPPELNNTDGCLTHVRAENIADIPKCFKYQWYAPRNAYVSSGPILREWSIENGRGGYREEPWRLYIHIQSKQELREIIIYDRDQIYRRIQTDKSKDFKIEINGYHDRQYFLTLEAWDVQDGHLVSPALYVSDLRQSIYMCTDLQNTLNCMQEIDPISGKFTYFGVLGNYVTGWDSLSPGILAAEWELMPQGLDYVVKGFGGGLSHIIYADGAQESAVARRDMVFACGDCNMLDNYYETKFYPGTFVTPTELADSCSRMISFTPRPYSYNMMLIEQEITFKQDLKFSQRDGAEVVGLTVSGPSEVFNKYSYNDGIGNKQSGERNDPITIKEGVINPGGYIALYPDFYGSFGVYALDNSCVFRLENATVTLGYDLAGKSVRAGDKLYGRWLLVRGKFGATEKEDADGFEEIRSLYGLGGKIAYNMNFEIGTIKDYAFALTLQADKYQVKGTIASAPLPNELPIIVKGLSNNWDAGMIDLDTKELRRCGVFGNSAYLTLDINKKSRNIVIGNLVACSNLEIKLTLFKENDNWYIEAHNPTDQEIRAEIQVAEWLRDILPEYNQSVSLQPGSMLRIKI